MKVWRGRNSLDLWLTQGKWQQVRSAFHQPFLASGLPLGSHGLGEKGLLGATQLRRSWSQSQKQLKLERRCQLPPCLTWPHAALWAPQSQSPIISTLLAPLFTRADPAQAQPQSPPHLPANPPYGWGVTFLLRNPSPFLEQGL